MPHKFRSLVASGDDEFRAELVERALTLNFSIRTIRSPEELPKYLQGRHFDWLFLDVELGQAQCLQIIAALSAGWRPRTVLVGTIDAAELESIRRSAVRAGLDVVGILAKPLSFPALMARLAALEARQEHEPNADLAARGLDPIPGNEIELHYQPIVSMRDRVVRRTEALVRWRHPEYGLIQPEGFIGLAERTGAIIPLTWDVMARAVDQQTVWNKQGLSLAVSVNVSALVLTSMRIADEILGLLEERGADPRTLILEITETVRAPDPAVARGLLARLREAGVGVSMDDYGVGYSDFGRLQYYPFSDLKMDRGLVARLPDDREARDIVSTLVSLAAREGVSLTAEGIETREQWDMLEGLGCNFAQGFLIARPMPAAQVKGWIEQMAKAGRYRPPRIG
ncbi:MAG: EAL domain-containing protein [Reyranella sp.]|uniref:EAL domain-containing response regulator n=1 Tax=Reyranella sp. TaxID=1929291 RepID=UPI0012091E5A|nr:EAL domain-containing protein [Reyranella sp.]TAJ87241.1 MAG: EAL domain-containing protein [Reyranella sp.]TBR27668.1 MAG: EAL domain-containing protein [Reyranella sp.]